MHTYVRVCRVPADLTVEACLKHVASVEEAVFPPFIS